MAALPPHASLRGAEPRALLRASADPVYWLGATLEAGGWQLVVRGTIRAACMGLVYLAEVVVQAGRLPAPGCKVPPPPPPLERC